MNRKYTLSFLMAILISACTTSNVGNGNRDDILVKGRELYFRAGCAVCHSFDGTEVYGPSLNNIHMKRLKVLRNGRELEITADRKYLKRAIINPSYEKPVRYRNREMPSPAISGDDAELLADYLIQLSKP